MEARQELDAFVSRLSGEGVTGRMKKVVESEETRKAMAGAIQKGWRLDLMIETYYDRAADGTLTMKPEMQELMKDMLPP